MKPDGLMLIWKKKKSDEETNIEDFEKLNSPLPSLIFQKEIIRLKSFLTSFKHPKKNSLSPEGTTSGHR